MREFEYFTKDGKLTRRTFIKGVGTITVSSAMGFGLTGCAQDGKEAPELAGTGDKQAEAPVERKTVSTYCSYNCNSSCQLKGTIVDGKIVAVEPGALPGRDDYANCCLRGISYPQRVQDETVRTMYPMKRTGERGSGEFERITWDEAIDTISEKLNAVVADNPAKATFYAFTGNMSRIAWEAPMRMAKNLGASIWTSEGIMSDHGATMGMVMCYGTQRAGHDTRDYMNSDLVMWWGGNSMDTHTSEARYLLNARDAGAKFIVVDPRLSPTAAMADQWVPIKPKGDSALAMAMINIIIGRGMHDETWLKNYSCAPLLVSDKTGLYIRPAEGMFAAWDEASNEMVVVDPAEAGGPDDGTSGPESTLALEGTFTVNGEKCHPAFADLVAEAAKFDLERASELTGLDAQTIEDLAIQYASAQTAGIRMTQGIQRIKYSFLPFRAIATLAAVCGNIGKSGGGASHIYSQGAGNPLKPVESETPLPDDREWEDVGLAEDMGPALLAAISCGNLELPTSLFYEAAVNHNPVGIDFLWVATSNFLNMSPDANKIIDEVFPAIDFIVCADPFWTWTAKYADIVLPAATNWENWDFNARSPWIQLQHPIIDRMGESKSDCEIMSLLAPKMGVGEYWGRTDEEWVRLMLDVDHPGVANMDFDKMVEEGCYGRDDGIYEPCYSWGDKKFATASGRFEFYTEAMVPFGLQVPTWRAGYEDLDSELGEKYPLTFLQYHDRMTIHAQHLLAPALKAVATEPLLQMNPDDAKARGIAHNDVVRIYNDRGECKVRAFVADGIRPSVVALPHGWPPDYFIEGNYQTLTHYKRNEAEDAFSQSNAAFYDVLVEVEKA